MRCIDGQRQQLKQLHDRAVVDTKAIEQALRDGDRPRAEELWLRVRVADLRARDFIAAACENPPVVEVEMIGPGGRRKYSGRSGPANGRRDGD